MRLVEKKCPNCGGALKFSFEDKETTCEFCGRSFEIERDEKIAEDKEEMFNADNYALTEEQKKAAAAVVRTVTAFQAVPILIFTVFFIAIVGFGIYSGVKSHKEFNKNTVGTKSETKVDNETKEPEKTTEEKLKEKGFVVSFKDLSDKDLKDIHDNTLSILKAETNRKDPFLYSHGGWSYVGSYLLYDKYGNKFYDVYKIVFKVNKKEVPYYNTVRYKDAKIVNGKLVLDMDGWVEGSLVSGSGQYAKDYYGYESTKDLYNKVIRGQIETNTVLVSGGVYNE